MTDELIINLAPTGMVPTRADSPYVPLTPGEVAADVRRCADLGAAIVHLHPRDDAGGPSQDPSVAATLIGAVRAAVPDIVICATTSGRIDPELGGRAAVLDLDGDVRPEMASLTLGSLNFPKQASVNARRRSRVSRRACATAASSPSGRSSTSGCSTMPRTCARRACSAIPST
jgi:3-oxoadipate:acetyl-CoA acetyltransferase